MQKTNREKTVVSGKNAVLLLFLFALVLVAFMWAMVKIFGAPDKNYTRRHDPEERQVLLSMTEPETEPTDPPVVANYCYPESDEETLILDEQIDCDLVMLTDVDSAKVLAIKGKPDERIYPASMTKLMTLIVAIEHIDDLTATFTMTDELVATLQEQQASVAGFVAGEEVTMTDLLYGAALPSGADGTTGLAISVAGSESAFVDMMNEKAEELGLKNTHFMNASGLHDPAHYSSMEDITVIMEYCLQNDLCKEIISTYQYTTRPTEQHPHGIELTSTMFNRMYGTEVEGISILGGKTGFTDEAGQCLVSYAETEDEHCYIAVTALSKSKWYNVYDSFKLYGVVTGTYSLDTKPAYTE
ncbi:MAG: D-alanyl-D-alanine carboxypeptidase [Oscillospiraceae bacterium]